jgi:hypothetical protein
MAQSKIDHLVEAQLMGHELRTATEADLIADPFEP